MDYVLISSAPETNDRIYGYADDRQTLIDMVQSLDRAGDGDFNRDFHIYKITNSFTRKWEAKK